VLAGGCFRVRLTIFDIEAENTALERAAGAGDLSVFRLDRRLGGMNGGAGLVALVLLCAGLSGGAILRSRRIVDTGPVNTGPVNTGPNFGSRRASHATTSNAGFSGRVLLASSRLDAGGTADRNLIPDPGEPLFLFGRSWRR
jgi:hypothetical protein